MAGVPVSLEAENNKAGSKSVVYILFFALVLLLPTAQITLFGWIFFTIPMTVLFYLYRWRFGFRFVIAGFFLAAVIGGFISSLGLVIFTSTLIGVGYSLAQSGFRSDSPALSGFKAAVLLGSFWILLLTAQTALTGINPISSFLGSLDHDVEQALGYYRQSETIAPDTMALLEQSFYQMKTIFPKILPSIMTSLILLIVWSTMLFGNKLVLKFTDYRPWPDHQSWKLPDKLIWALIAAALITLIPVAPLRITGINVLICLSLIYLFQGFSVLSFFMHRWNVPQVLRFFLYAMMLFQSFGTALLIIIGIGDVWLDLRRLKKNQEDSNDHDHIDK